MNKKLLLVFILVMSLVAGPCFAVTEKQEEAIVKNCAEIKEQLKNTQKNDARVRVHLGSRYETILSKFIMPLNVRLIENNLSNASLVENQTKFAETRKVFNEDYINYQQGLEELVAIDCKNKPSEFYEKLEKVRQKRKTVEQDAAKMNSLISDHMKQVRELAKGL